MHYFNGKCINEGLIFRDINCLNIMVTDIGYVNVVQMCQQCNNAIEYKTILHGLLANQIAAFQFEV